VNSGPSAQEIDEFQRIIATDDFPAFASTYLKVQSKTRGLISFDLWPMQLDLWNTIKRLSIRRSLTLKYRQGGFTKFWLGVHFYRALTTPDTHCLLMAHEKELPTELLADVGIFLEFLPKWFDVDLSRKSASEIYFKDMRSSIRIGTGAMLTEGAGAKLGRTVQHLHVTEAADPRWKEDTFNMLFQTVPVGSSISIESTAKGARGWFRNEYKNAVAGRSTFHPFFYEWWWQPEYQMDPPSDFVPTEREAWLMKEKGLTARQIAFRRFKIDELRGERNFLELYPEDDESCFLLTGANYFDSTALRHQLESSFCAKDAVGRRFSIRQTHTTPIQY